MDVAVCAVISKIQTSDDADEIDECWKILLQCIFEWLSGPVDTGQRLDCFEELCKIQGFFNHEVELCQLFGNVAISDGQFDEANCYLSRVIAHDRSSPELFETVSNIRNNLIVRWSFRMLNDSARNGAFKSAIAAAITEHQGRCSVLDLGSGTGLLSLYAAEAGAGKVYAVEQDEHMFEICKKVTCKLPVIDTQHCSSAEFDVNSNKVDLVVTETLDSIGIGEGMLVSCADIAVRSSHHVTFIPSRVGVQGFLVQSETLEHSHHPRNPEQNYTCEFLDEFQDCVKLSEAITLLDVKLGQSAEESVSVAAIRVEKDGVCCGVSSYFTAHLYGGVSITTAPSTIDTNDTRVSCWEQGFHPLPRRTVKSGSVVKIEVTVTPISISVSWHETLLADCVPHTAGSLIHAIVDPGGLVVSDPFLHPSVKTVSFQGYIIHSDQLRSWCQVNTLSLHLDSDEADSICLEMNKYQTLIHEGVPWCTLEHTKLSDYLTFLTVSRQHRDTISRSVSETPVSNLSPTALVFWVEIELQSGERFSTVHDARFRPAAVLLSSVDKSGDVHRVTSLFRGSSFAACISST